MCEINEDCDKTSREYGIAILSAMGGTEIGESTGNCFWDLSCVSQAGDRVCVELKARNNDAWKYDTWTIGAHKLNEFRRVDSNLYEEDTSTVPLSACFDKFLAISIYPGLKKFTMANVAKDYVLCKTKMMPKKTLWDGGDEELVPKTQLYFNFKHNFEYVEVGGQIWISRIAAK